ncbi:MAG: hypothetical protein LQ350_007984 [Teloschistes chrysophthalmus]|nr:MAG: hypothetical protein LQ350_007984 [Niorma chrysophthalma]
MVAQIMITVSTLSGLGNHIGLLWVPQLVKALRWSWIGQIVAIQAIGFGKIAVIAFLLRIQERNTKLKKLAWFLYFIAVSNVIINIDQMVLILLQCSPSRKLWNPSVPGTCYHIRRTNNVGYFQGSKLLWLTFEDRAAAAGIVKTVYIKLISVEADPTYAISTLVIWAYTENWLVLILGSLPPLRSLFLRVFDQVSTSASRSRTARYEGYNQTHSLPDTNGRGGKGNNIHMYPVVKKTPATSDDDSERNILPDSGYGRMRDPYGPGILRTTEIRQTIRGQDEKDDGSDDSLGGLERPVV